MFSYKQRYKPRTEREYTKTDLTVYDSAGNTALRGLKVYGKSEIVDGAIKSAGEGYAVVDLGTLNWQYNSGLTVFLTSDLTALIKPNIDDTSIATNVLTANYRNDTINNTIKGRNNLRISTNSRGELYISNFSYTDATAFKSAMSGVLLCYQLADPTQGNAIAIKTDNGSGINGTMATFSTGTPLYGASDTTRDVMTWDGSAGTVAKNCAKVRLADLTWLYTPNLERFYATLETAKMPNSGYLRPNIIAPKYETRTWVDFETTDYDKFITGVQTFIGIRDTDYTTVEDFVASLGDTELVYELATPTTEPLTQTENESIANLRTFDGTTHFTNNAQTDMTVNYTIRVPTIN